VKYAGSGGVHFPAYDLNGNVMGWSMPQMGISRQNMSTALWGSFLLGGRYGKGESLQFSTKYTTTKPTSSTTATATIPRPGSLALPRPHRRTRRPQPLRLRQHDPVNKWDMLGLQAEFIRSLHSENWKQHSVEYIPYDDRQVGCIRDVDCCF
jgi:hypothetical protein